MLGVGCEGPLGPVRLLPAPPPVAPGDPPVGTGSASSGGGSGSVDGGGGDAGSACGLGRIGEREAWAVLASVDGIGPASFASLVRRFGSAVAVLDRALAGVDALRELPDDPDAAAVGRMHLDEAALARIAAAARCPEEVLDDASRLGLTIVTLEDEAYPPALRATELAPPVLFTLGDLRAIRHVPAIAVVGTRRPTERGRRTAARIAGAVARAGAAVVSGLAIGIDGVAHEAALAEGARTVAVLGAGHRHVTPAAHRALARRIVDAGGAIVSEYRPSALPTTWSFPRRNRVISGVTSATVVVEAAIRSGALITAAWALEQGRECFLVPGSLDDDAAQGSLRFLRDHSGLARVVAGVPELLEDLGLAGTAEAPAAAAVGPALGDTGRRVAALVAAGRGTVDEITAGADLPAATVLGVLTVLELQGLVVAAVGRYRPAGLLATRGAGGAGVPSRQGSRSGSRSVASGSRPSAGTETGGVREARSPGSVEPR